MHREVEITVESCNKGGSMIGWLFVGNVNLSLALVKEGLAKVHRSAERSEYFKLLQQAEKEAKDKKLNVNITILNEYNDVFLKNYLDLYNVVFSYGRIMLRNLKRQTITPANLFMKM